MTGWGVGNDNGGYSKWSPDLAGDGKQANPPGGARIVPGGSRQECEKQRIFSIGIS